MENRKVIIHAENYKYIDKKMVNGKWRYYYDTGIHPKPYNLDNYKSNLQKLKEKSDMDYDSANAALRDLVRYKESNATNKSDSLSRHKQQQFDKAYDKSNKSNQKYVDMYRQVHGKSPTDVALEKRKRQERIKAGKKKTEELLRKAQKAWRGY